MASAPLDPEILKEMSENLGTLAAKAKADDLKDSQRAAYSDANTPLLQKAGEFLLNNFLTEGRPGSSGEGLDLLFGKHVDAEKTPDNEKVKFKAFGGPDPEGTLRLDDSAAGLSGGRAPGLSGG